MSTRSFEAMSVGEQRDLARRRERLGLVLFLALSVFVLVANAYVMPNDSLIALVLLTMALVGIFVKPLVGVYVTVIFTLLGDINTTPWYPFAKNFSSVESLLFVSDEFIVNPLEIVLLATLSSWLLRSIIDPTWRFRRGRLLVPSLVFSAFVVVGLAYGLVRNGNVNVGLWEARPLLYLPLFYVLVTNLVPDARTYERIMWVALVSITGQSLLAIQWYLDLPDVVRGELRSLTEHSASVHFNAVIMMLFAAFLLPKCTVGARISVVAMTIPVTVAYILAERRSAFIGLSLAIILFCVFLFRVRRSAFWIFAPAVAVIGFGYVAAFWNAEGGIAFPAQAIKSAIAPGQLTGADQSSVDYREIEAINVWFTIRSNPDLGIGFGQPFYRIYPLPDIGSIFGFWEFMPHHSFLWIWLKTGYLGFVSMLFLIVRSIQLGARTALTARPGNQQAVALTAVLYIVMYMVFSYVDIAWDIRSMVFLVVAMSISADMDTERQGRSSTTNRAEDLEGGVSIVRSTLSRTGSARASGRLSSRELRQEDGTQPDG